MKIDKLFGIFNFNSMKNYFEPVTKKKTNKKKLKITEKKNEIFKKKK